MLSYRAFGQVILRNPGIGALLLFFCWVRLLTVYPSLDPNTAKPFQRLENKLSQGKT